uniref:EamA domain-containing protein n=1 Tax=Angiostrongylus cantonensis TaxID=6313 RepID=A0A0K0DD01_ANGCA
MLAVFGGTPLLFVFDAFSIEKLHPLPNREQIGIVFLSGLFGISTTKIKLQAFPISDICFLEGLLTFIFCVYDFHYLLGTLLADYLWLTAAALTDSLSASLSMTLAIPFSFFADAVLQRQLPSRMQLLAAIPITVSFIAAALLDHKRASPEIPDVRQSSGEEDEAALLENDES